jgi:protein kinase X
MDGITQDERYLYLMLEFIRGGELFTYLRGKGKFEPPQA